MAAREAGISAGRGGYLSCGSWVLGWERRPTTLFQRICFRADRAVEPPSEVKLLGVLKAEPGDLHDVFHNFDNEEQLLWEFFGRPNASFSLRVMKAARLQRQVIVNYDRKNKPLST
eukprot:2636507-Pyramimonas_sp.AAC.1